MKIKIPQFSSKGVEIIKSEPDLIILNDYFFQKKWKATAIVTDNDENIPLEKKTIGIETLSKDKITGTACQYDNKEEIYEVTIFTISNNSSVFFPDWASALDFHNKVLNWLYPIQP